LDDGSLTPRNVLSILGSVGSWDSRAIWVSDQKPSSPHVGGRVIVNGELVENNGCWGFDLGTRPGEVVKLGSVEDGDGLEDAHVEVGSGHELDSHGGPSTSSIKIPLNSTFMTSYESCVWSRSSWRHS